MGLVRGDENRRKKASMKFGIFEHMDDSGVPQGQHFSNRLSLIEQYDRHGFYAYHLAEHHGTPLGLAPSPSVFLSAVAQRTKRLRFGPLVYSLPLYHPVRLIEEICMLDQMSGGRFELGVGRGVSPIEVGFFGVNPADGSRQFPEALKIIKQGLTSDELTFSGEFYKFDKVPMVLKPVQRPHPPLWYGVLTPDAAYWAALEDAHIVTLVPPQAARAIFDRYRAEWEKFGRPAGNFPLMGLSRHIVLADTETDAKATAERGYRRWLNHMELLWTRHGMKLPLGLPPEIGPLLQNGSAFAGTAATFRAYLDEQIKATKSNYFVCDVAFGDLTPDETMRTVRLLAQDVMPLFTDKHGAGSDRGNGV
jgi:alkanesulfonate monooxygenase SsuD/methylene tetrahydromethanopterin reductase-like flavin-dependent oxidoreductase (luciferase family)